MDVTTVGLIASGDVGSTLPLAAYAQVSVEPLVGKVVIDRSNYYLERDAAIDVLDAHATTTSQLLQDHLPGTHVVKAFNKTFYRALGELARPEGAADRSVPPVFGDHTTAKDAVAAFPSVTDYDALDAGSLANSWRAENGKPAYVYPYCVDAEPRTPSSRR